MYIIGFDAYCVMLSFFFFVVDYTSIFINKAKFAAAYHHLPKSYVLHWTPSFQGSDF